jgi:ribosomal protein L29
VKSEVLASKLREESEAELLAKHVQLKKEIYESRSLITTNAGKEQAGKVRAAKKQIARILTVLRERELSQS